VLDENKMLCLTNGQRIKLPNTFYIFFELDDLKQTSPATVTRCGMIYFDDSIINWVQIFQRWNITFMNEFF
jgi:dynein heavy chain